MKHLGLAFEVVRMAIMAAAAASLIPALMPTPSARLACRTFCHDRSSDRGCSLDASSAEKLHFCHSYYIAFAGNCQRDSWLARTASYRNPSIRSSRRGSSRWTSVLSTENVAYLAGNTDAPFSLVLRIAKRPKRAPGSSPGTLFHRGTPTIGITTALRKLIAAFQPGLFRDQSHLALL
jgi:hypothetical protein